MKIANKIWTWLDKWLPYLWGGLIILAITGGLVGLMILVVKWILGLLGVL